MERFGQFFVDFAGLDEFQRSGDRLGHSRADISEFRRKAVDDAADAVDTERFDNLLDGLLDAVLRVLHSGADALCGVFCLRREAGVLPVTVLVELDERLIEVLEGDLATLHRLIQVVLLRVCAKDALGQLVHLARHCIDDTSPCGGIDLVRAQHLVVLFDGVGLQHCVFAAGQDGIVERQCDAGGLVQILGQRSKLLDHADHA